MCGNTLRGEKRGAFWPLHMDMERSCSEGGSKESPQPSPTNSVPSICYKKMFLSFTLTFSMFAGRTGRAGKTGDAYSFICSSDPSKTVRDLVELLQRSKKDVPQELRDLAFSGGSRYGGGRGGRPPMNAYSRGGSSSYGSSRGGYQSAPSAYPPSSSSYNYGSSASFNQSVLNSVYSAPVPAVAITDRVGEKRPRESFSTYDDDERRYRRDDRDRRDDSRDRRDYRRDDSRDRRVDSRDRRVDSRDRLVDSRDRRADSRDRRVDSRDRRADSRDRRDRRVDSRDRAPAY